MDASQVQTTFLRRVMTVHDYINIVPHSLFPTVYTEPHQFFFKQTSDSEGPVISCYSLPSSMLQSLSLVEN